MCASQARVNQSLYQETTPSVSIERSDWLKQEGWLNARAAERNSPETFVEYWISAQARIDTDVMVWLKQKHPRQLIKLALAHSNNLSRAKALDKIITTPSCV